MKKVILFVLSMSLLASTMATPPSQLPLTVAVYDFTDADKGTEELGNKVTPLITADLTTETNLIMVERSDLKRALGEQAIGISGMVSSDQAAKIGQITGAKVLVSGQVINSGKDRIVIVANIVGTETSRLFAVKVEGTIENLADLSSELSRKIALKIHEQASYFVKPAQSHEDYLNQIVRNVTGTNRPTVSIDLHFPRGSQFPSDTANNEMGLILQKAGFTVVDGNSERKPDVEITGVVAGSAGPKQGGLFSYRTVIDAKVQERRTGKIIAFERQIADGVDVGMMVANRNSQTRVTDALAEKILPLLAQSNESQKVK